MRGLRRPIVRSEHQAMEVFFEGETNRVIAEHALNKASTRSHCVFSIYLERRITAASAAAVVGVGEDGQNSHDDDDALPTTTTTVLRSKLHFVDLAGSERVAKTQSMGDTLNEAKFINKSLSFLEQVVLALVGKAAHVPYRSSKLTHLLQDSLGGNCKTRLIACLWSDAPHMLESLATMRFATRMMRVKTRLERNVGGSGERSGTLGSRQGRETALVRRYEREIRALRRELAMYDAITGTLSSPSPPPLLPHVKLDANDRCCSKAAEACVILSRAPLLHA